MNCYIIKPRYRTACTISYHVCVFVCVCLSKDIYIYAGIGIGCLWKDIQETRNSFLVAAFVEGNSGGGVKVKDIFSLCMFFVLLNFLPYPCITHLED